MPAAALCFATIGTARALGPDDVSPLQVGAARVVLGGALLAAWAVLVGGRRDGGAARADALRAGRTGAGGPVRGSRP